MTISYLAILASPWIIRRWLANHVQPRRAAHYFFGSIVAIGVATGIMLALILVKFVSGSLLAAMGEACRGIFEASQGFLAESRLNYLLAVVAAAIFFSQLAFLLGGGTRLFRASNRLKKSRGRSGMSCPALADISHDRWAGHVYLVPDGAIEAQTIGLVKPRILLHSGLVEALSGEELLAVAAHEDAHRCGNDNLLAAAAKAVTLTLFYLPGPKMAYRELCRSLEMAADNKAAQDTGGPLFVASALARIITMTRASDKSVVMETSVSGNSMREVTCRLENLTSEKKSSRGAAGLSILFLAAVAAILLAFSSSALAVTEGDQRATLICYSRHTAESAPGGVCLLGHPQHS